MSYQPHYIANYEPDSGLFTYTEPFLAPEKAFPVLEDAYCWRGRVQRRLGNKLLGQLRHQLTNVSIGNISSATTTKNLFTALGIDTTEPNAQIAPPTQPFPISITIGAPISQTLTDNTGTGVMTIAPGGAITGATINYATGVLTLVFGGVIGASASTISMWYYPGLPVMGCCLQESPSVDNQLTIFFDTKYAYIYNNSSDEFDDLPSTAPTVWHGLDYNLFWTTNYWSNVNGDLFWATNDNMVAATRDPIRYYDTKTWTDFTPLITGTTNLYTALIVLPYKNRLIFMNTWEGTTAGGINLATNHPQTIRWSWNGDPTNVQAFRTDIVGKGGYLNAPTNEAITSAEFIKDTLIVKTERSSWKLVYTGNEILPFVFQKINTTFGSESPFSTVPFDRGVYTISDVGITTDDSVNVERIDVQIPQTVFDFNLENNGLQRIYGIRDYVNELVYWAYPNQEDDDPTSSQFPNQVLVYNYRNNTYAIFNDSFTCYGYLQETEQTWAQLTYKTWADWITPWAQGAPDSIIPDVVAGNQQGFVVSIAKDVLSDPSLAIASINTVASQITSPNHNLFLGDVIQLTGIIGTLSVLNGNTYVVQPIDQNTIQLCIYSGDNLIFAPLPTGTYLGGGLISRWNGLNIQTKVFAPFYEQGSQCRIGYIDFLLDKTDDGQITSQIFVNENNSISMTDPSGNDAVLGSNVVNTCPEDNALVPFQQTQDKIWHRQFTQIIAQNFQIQLTMTPKQLLNVDYASSDFVLHAMAMYLSPNARLTQ